MLDFDPQRYGPAVAELLEGADLGCLGPGLVEARGRPDQERASTLQGLTVDLLLDGRPVTDADAAACCLSGLWLAHGFLDQSHSISQAIETTSGSYWHGLMHRREGDFSNAKYWFRRVGRHPVFAELGPRASELAANGPPAERGYSEQTRWLAAGEWDPARFIDLCAACERSDTPLTSLCRAIAASEWCLLFDYCYQGALRS